MTPHFDATWMDPTELDFRVVARAKRLMRRGLDLYEAALALDVRSRDLDLSIWRHFGTEGWAEPATVTRMNFVAPSLVNDEPDEPDEEAPRVDPDARLRRFSWEAGQ